MNFLYYITPPTRMSIYIKTFFNILYEFFRLFSHFLSFLSIFSIAVLWAGFKARKMAFYDNQNARLWIKLKKIEKSVDIFKKMVYNEYTKIEKCRCRLAVWRQLPKLFPASSTLVTCSKKRTGVHFGTMHLELFEDGACFY